MPDFAETPVTVEIRRRVRPEARALFEKDLQSLIRESLEIEGNLGVTVHKPDQGAKELEYRVVLKFDRESRWRAWQQSDQLSEWYTVLRQHLVADPEVSEVTGLEAWFTLPGERVMVPPPRHKMALVTWFAVFSCVTLVSLVVKPFSEGWNPHLRNLAVTGMVVLLLTYLVMPNLVRLLKGWLNPHN